MKEINTNTSNTANSTPFLHNGEKKDNTVTNDYSLFDKDHNGIIDKKEQQAGIFNKINILLESDMQSCFGSDISYEKGNQASKTNADNLTKERQAKAIQLAESPDYINKKILDKGTEIFHELKNPKREVMGYTIFGGEKIEFFTKYNNEDDNDDYYREYDDGSTRIYNSSGQWIEGTDANGREYKVNILTNGNYSLDFRDKISMTGNVNIYSKEGDLISIREYTDKNKFIKYNTRKNSYKTNLQNGISINYGNVDINSLKDDVNINKAIESSKQGKLGDCYFLAQINALAGTDFGKKAIKNSIKDNKNGTYTVSLKGANKKYTISKQEILYAKSLTQDGSKVYAQGDDDVVLLEIAFEKYYTDIQGYASNQFIKNSETKLIHVQNKKNESFENRSPFAYGGYGGNFGRENTNTDFLKLLTGEHSFIGFDLNADSPEAAELILKQKALYHNNVASTYSLGKFKKGYNSNDVPKEYKDAQAENHQLNIVSVVLDEDKKNIKSVKIFNSWYDNKITEVPYDIFLKIISLSNQNNIWIASNNNNVNNSIEEFTDNYAKEIAQELEQQENSGDFFKLLNNDDYGLRPKIVKYYGGMEKLINDIMKKTPEEWNNSTRSNKPETLEEYQQGVMDVFIQASGLFKNITMEEYQAIKRNREKGLRSYCLYHGIKY